MKRKRDDAERWAKVARWAVAIAVYLVGAIVLVPRDERHWTWQPTVVLLAAVAVFHFLKFVAERERERRIDVTELRTNSWQQ